MKPQFTIRDWLWFVPMALLFIHAIGNQVAIDRLRDKWANVERMAWGAIGNDRGFDTRIDWLNSDIGRIKHRLSDLEDEESPRAVEIAQLQNIVCDHQRALTQLRKVESK